MTVDFNQSDVVLRIQYLADGKQVEFYIPFPIFSPNDVEVYTNAVLQTDTYYIPWPEQQGRFRAIFLSPPAAGSTIILRRCMEITRNSRFQESGRLSAKALNTEFDYVAAALQQVYAESARAIRLNPTDEEAALLLPVREERANNALVFDSQGNTSVSAMPRQLSDISEDSHFKHFTAEQEAKLSSIEPAATADQTGAEIVAAINGELGGNGWQSSDVADNSVSNAKLADVASGTLKGRASANGGDPEDLGPAQVRGLLNVADGATAAGAAGDAFAASHPTAGHAAATATTAGFMAAADKAKLNAATASATASTLMVRDANGRAQVANPSANADVANKSYVDTAVAIKLDDLGVPDDNTDLDATTARHGLLPKLDGDVGHVLRGDGTFGTVPGGGGGAALGTTLAVYADDPLIGSTDDVIEVYLGKRVTLPTYNAGKRDRIVIINAGNSASVIKAHQTPSVVRGVALADDGTAGTYSQRFVLSGHTSNAVFGKVMTFAAWVRAANDGATSRCLFSIIDGTKYFRVITTGTYSGANLGDYLALQSYDGTRLVLDVRFPWTRGVLHHVVASINVGASPNPVAKCAIDGISVAPLAGWTMLNYPLLGGNITGTPRIGSGIAANSIQEWSGSIAQLAFWNVFSGVALEENIRLFYNDGPVDFGANGRALGASPGTPPLIFFNAEPTASYQVVNAGTMGGSGGGTLGGGTFTDATPPASIADYALAAGGVDAPLLEQIDGFPAGYTLPVGQEARFIRRASKGVWGVF